MATVQKAEKAVALRAAHTHNCCQAVAVALGESYGLDPEMIRRFASGFGGGMGSMEGVCGALVGAVMISGIAMQSQSAVPKARKIQNAFVQQTGALLCKDLKGRDSGIVLCPCEECVRCAVRAFDEVMEDPEQDWQR